MFGENGLGVKLHTFDVEGAMTHPHHDAIGTACTDGQGSANRFRVFLSTAFVVGLGWV
mgnify:CR=1 FL=1